MIPVELKEALHNGGPVFGTLIVSPSPFWPKVLGDSGLDFVFIDTEHIALDRSQVSWMCRTYKAMGLPPLVRIVSPSPYEATMVLDDGAAGVVACRHWYDNFKIRCPTLRPVNPPNHFRP